jgi:hypothetical protein
MAGLYNPAIKVTNESKAQQAIDKIKSKLNAFNGPEARLKKYDLGSAEYKKAASEALAL